MFREKLRDKPAAHPDFAGSIVVQTKPWARFTFKSDDLRAHLAAKIKQHEIDLLVVAPLSRVGMESSGTLDQISIFGELIRRVREIVGRPFAVLLVHHENRAPGRGFASTSKATRPWPHERGTGSSPPGRSSTRPPVMALQPLPTIQPRPVPSRERP